MKLRNLTLLRILNIILLLLLVVIYQSLFSELLTIQKIKLDLPLLILVYVGLTQGPVSGAILGFLIGLLLDIPSHSFLGLGAFIKTSLGYLVGSFKDKLFLESNLSKAGVIFISLLLNDLAYYLLSSGFNLRDTFSILLNYSILSGLYTSSVGFLFLWYLKVRRTQKIAGNFSTRL